MGDFFFLSEQNNFCENSNFSRIGGKGNKGGHGKMGRQITVRTDMSGAKKIQSDY